MESVETDTDNHYLVDDTSADVGINYYRDEYIHSNITDSTLYSDKCSNFSENIIPNFLTNQQKYDDIFEKLKSSESGNYLKE